MAEHVEMWQDKMRRLEAHGEEYNLAPEHKINALRMFMIGKAKGYSDFWEAGRDPTDAAKAYEELLNTVKDYARRRKMDRRRCSMEVTPWMLELSKDTAGKSTTTTRTASPRWGSRAKARAKGATAN